jgi:hypothetical protein
MYMGIAIFPGRNAIPDGIGVKLMTYKPFVDAIDADKSPITGGKIIIRVLPAGMEDPKKAAKKLETKGVNLRDDGPVAESPVANLSLSDAIKQVRSIDSAESLENIILLESRGEIREEALKRVEDLKSALAAKADGGAGA